MTIKVTKGGNVNEARALRAVAPVFPFVSDGLEIGTQEAQEYFQTRNKPVNLSLAPSIVRYELKEHLSDKVMFIHDCEAEDMANNGVSLRIGDCHVRVWKDMGDAPVLGSSKTRARFLRQQRPFIQLKFDFAQRIVHNLAILWAVNDDYTLKQLYLASPKKDMSGEQPPEWEWKIPVDPADVLGSMEPLLEAMDLDLPFEPVQDDDDDEDEAKEGPQ